MRQRTSSCIDKAKQHKIKYFKRLKELADNDNIEAMFVMIQLAETGSVEQEGAT